jgi:hypothetical protein
MYFKMEDALAMLNGIKKWLKCIINRLKIPKTLDYWEVLGI